MNEATNKPRKPKPIKPFKFLKVKDRVRGGTGWWLLEIRDTLTLTDWYMETQPSLLGNAFSNYFNSRELHYLHNDKACGRPHISSGYAAMMLWKATKSADTEGKIPSALDILQSIGDDIFNYKYKEINKGKKVYINSNGIGWFSEKSITDKYEILEERLSESLVYPEPTIKVSQWPEGSHYYATVDNVQVEIDGKVKWNTAQEAEEAAKKFIKNKRM